jgi:hypothetical protein
MEDQDVRVELAPREFKVLVIDLGCQFLLRRLWQLTTSKMVSGLF